MGPPNLVNTSPEWANVNIQVVSETDRTTNLIDAESGEVIASDVQVKEVQYTYRDYVAEANNLPEPDHIETIMLVVYNNPGGIDEIDDVRAFKLEVGKQDANVVTTPPGTMLQRPEVRQVFNTFELERPPSTATTTPSTGRLSQITDDSFNVEIPQGWIIHDINNTGAALSEETRVGYGLLSQLCPEEEQQSAGFSVNTLGDNTNNTSSNNSCQTTQEVVHVIRYPDLVTRIQPDNNITAYHLEKLEEVGYNNIQIVNSANRTVNIRNPITNETITSEPAKFVEMTYRIVSNPNEARRGYFILTATNWTAPDAGTIKGYSLFYEGHSTNSTATAARPEIATTSTSDSLSPTLLPPEVAQLFDTFELTVAPELAQARSNSRPNPCR